MTSYKFETDQFGISDTGIHLLRSGYNYETIEFNTIDHITLMKGRQISNWLLALAFGVLLISVGLYVFYHVFYEYFIGQRIHIFYVEQIVFPIIPLIIGTYTVFISLKNDLILQLTIHRKTKNLPLDRLVEQAQMDGLIGYLSSNPLSKHKFRETVL